MHIGISVYRLSLSIHIIYIYSYIYICIYICIDVNTLWSHHHPPQMAMIICPWLSCSLSLYIYIYVCTCKYTCSILLMLTSAPQWCPLLPRLTFEKLLLSGKDKLRYPHATQWSAQARLHTASLMNVRSGPMRGFIKGSLCPS